MSEPMVLLWKIAPKTSHKNLWRSVFNLFEIVFFLLFTNFFARTHWEKPFSVPQIFRKLVNEVANKLLMIGLNSNTCWWNENSAKTDTKKYSVFLKTFKMSKIADAFKMWSWKTFFLSGDNDVLTLASFRPLSCIFFQKFRGLNITEKLRF